MFHSISNTNRKFLLERKHHRHLEAIFNQHADGMLKIRIILDESPSSIVKTGSSMGGGRRESEYGGNGKHPNNHECGGGAASGENIKSFSTG